MNHISTLLMKAIDVILASVEFIVLSYLLLSAMFSFKTSPIYILFFAVNVVVIQKFLSSLKGALRGNIEVVAVFVTGITVVTVLFLNLGYLSMSIMPL